MQVQARIDSQLRPAKPSGNQSITSRKGTRSLNNPKSPQSPSMTSGSARRRRTQLSHRNLPLLMLQAREQVTACFRPIFRSCGLTEQQWRILRALYEHHEMMISQLAESCLILGPSLTGILQRMIDADLVVKRLDALDTRRFHVSLTKQGRAKFEAMAPLVEDAYANLERRVGKATIAELYRILDDLVTRMDATSSGASEDNRAATRPP